MSYQVDLVDNIAVSLARKSLFSRFHVSPIAYALAMLGTLQCANNAMKEQTKRHSNEEHKQSWLGIPGTRGCSIDWSRYDEYTGDKVVKSLVAKIAAVTREQMRPLSNVHGQLCGNDQG